MIRHPVLTALATNASRGGLARVQSFLEHIGATFSVPVVHIAGTNGKGSVVRILSAILQDAGYTVGSFTSPHLQRLNERICVNDAEIDDATLDALLWRLEQAREEWACALGGGVPDAEAMLNFFEMLTVAGMVHLGQVGVDVCLLEVGLGGRLDATNIVDPLISAIVSVSMDHQDRLGADLASIAAEKAGIIKTNRPVILGPVGPDALRVIRLIATERQAPLCINGEHFRTLRSEEGRFTWTGRGQTIRDLPLKLVGDHQVDNAGVALAILDGIKHVMPVTEANIRAGLARVEHPGRLEWLADDLLVDAAHNAAGATTLAQFLDKLPRDKPRTLVLGASQDKDVRSMVIQLAAHVDRVLTTHCGHPRAASAADLAERLVGMNVPILPAGAIEQALPLARGEEGVVIVTGSLHVVGAARDIVEGRWLRP